MYVVSGGNPRPMPFDYEEFLRNIQHIPGGDLDTALTGGKPNDRIASLPSSLREDWYDFSSGSPLKMLSVVQLGEMSMETALHLSNAISLNSDGTANQVTDEELLQYLRENGMPTALEWYGIENAHFAFLSHFSIGAGHNVSDIISEMSASYAALKDQIERNFTGDDQAEQLARLDQLFEKHVDLLAESYANEVTERMGPGMADDRDNLYQSVKEAAYHKTEEYDRFLKENGDFLGLSDTEDAWLRDHYRYMSSQLKKAVGTDTGIEQPDVAAQSGLYTASDLDEIQHFADRSQKILSTGVVGHSSEEEIGLRLGLMALKADYLMDSSKASQKYKDLLLLEIQRAISKTIRMVDEAYRYERDNPRTGGADTRYAPQDVNAIYGIINTIRDTYHVTGDVEKAIYTGVNKGSGAFYKKQEDSSYNGMHRYGKNSSAVWDRMFEVPAATGGVLIQTYLRPVIEQIFHSFRDLFGQEFSTKFSATV